MTTKHNVKEIHAKILKAEEEANEYFFERAEFIRLIYGCLLASKRNKDGVKGRRINLSVVANPGTAKSEVGRFILGGIEGANFWTRQLNKYSKPEDILGRLDPKVMMETGDCYHRTKNKAPEQHVALLDEGWNASSSMLQTLQLWTNEGCYVNEIDGEEQEFDTNLMFCIIAANKIPDDEGAAMYDRFTVRHTVDKIKGQEEKSLMLYRDANVSVSKDNQITLEELEFIQEHIENIEVPQEVMDKVVAIDLEAADAKFVVSDRRLKNGLFLAKAYAFLHGHEEVQDEDLECFENILWDDPKREERNRARDVVLKVANPVAREIEELINTAEELTEKCRVEKDEDRRMDLFKEARGASVNAQKRVKNHLKVLEREGKLTGKYESKLRKFRLQFAALAADVTGNEVDDILNSFSK